MPTISAMLMVVIHLVLLKKNKEIFLPLQEFLVKNEYLTPEIF